MSTQSTLTLAEELTWRGFIHQTSFSDIKELNTPRTFYWGVDPSADSMHVGNLAPAMMIRHLMNHGHNAILLVGGATGMIGDPDGKRQERDTKSLDEVAKNKRAIASQYETIFSGQRFEVVDNYNWFTKINYLDFLRDVGKHTSMTQLLDRDFIQSRIGEDGSGISYAEFSYALIQGYDFLHLYREKNATLQVSGADQWGNCITGVQLIRRLESDEAHIVTTPLIVNKSTGKKFGKTEDGAVWLDPQKTSPYKFYQFWLNVDDDTAQDLVKIYTLLERSVIEDLIEAHKTNPAARALQKTLAREVTDLVHGVARRQSVERVTRVLFGGASAQELSSDDLDALAQEIAVTGFGSLSEILTAANLVGSNAEARRLIASGAVTLDGEKAQSDVNVSTVALLKKGKNSFVLIR